MTMKNEQDYDQLKARAEAAEKWKWTFGGLGGTPEIAWAFYKGLENNKIAWQEKAEAAEVLVGELEAEINQARRAWLGDDYGHLPLIAAMEKYRADVEARVAELEEVNRLRVPGSCQCGDDDLCAIAKRAEQAESRNARLVAAGDESCIPCELIGFDCTDRTLTIRLDRPIMDLPRMRLGQRVGFSPFALAYALAAAQTTPKPPADDDGLTDADFAELVQEFKQSKHPDLAHPDTARLDWLAKEDARVICGPAGFFIYWGDTNETNGEWQTERFGTPRAAIDAAMQSAKEGQA